MARGRNSKPPEVKEKMGNPGNRPIPKPDELEDIPGLSDAGPEWLTVAGQQIWQLLAPDLRQLKFLRRTDELAFARYCDLYSDWLAIISRLELMEGRLDHPDGPTVYETKSAHGNMRRNEPLYKDKMFLNRELSRLEVHFGLTPSSRLSMWSQQLTRGMPAGGLFARDAGISEPTGSEGDDLSPSAALSAMQAPKQLQ